jgi:hypothetical protein
MQAAHSAHISFLRRFHYRFQQVADHFVTQCCHTNLSPSFQQFADHPSARMGLSRTRRPLNRKNGILERQCNSARCILGLLPGERRQFLSFAKARRFTQQQISPGAILACRVDCVCGDPFPETIKSTRLCVRVERGVPHVDRWRVDVRRFLCFLDLDDSLCRINGNHLAESLVSEVQILADSHVGRLRVEKIAVRWNQSSCSDTLDEAHSSQSHPFVQQLFLVHVREPIAFLPGSLVLAPVPTEQLRQKPLR